VVPAEGKIHLISLRPGGRDREFDADTTFCIDISRDGSLVAAGTHDQVRVWKVSSLRQIAQLRGGLGIYESVSFSPDSHRVVASDNAGVTCLWDLATGREVARFERGLNIVDARFQPSGETLAIGVINSGKGGLELLRAPSWEEIAAAEKTTEGKNQ
jgi:WD40 repeat protein